MLACAAVAVTLVTTAVVPYFTNKVSQHVIPSANVAASTPLLVNPSQDPFPPASAVPQQPANTMGNPNAPVKIVEFADFQCPYCMRFAVETEPKIIEQYVKTGKVFYEYHSVGAFLGDESGAAAQAAYCAGDQGRFWEYHNTLFANWTGENVGDFTNDKLQKYAASIGLDTIAFNDCLSTGKYAPLLDQDVQAAKAAGIRATPSFLVNGKLIEGAVPFADFQQAIDAALQGK